MDYIIASTAVTDEIHFADEKTVGTLAGGAGIYALCGIKLWSDTVMIVTGVGRDYPDIYGAWYENNGISMEGLIYKEENTPHNVIRYFEDGERSEIPLYGEDHYKRIEVMPKELEACFDSSKGIYIFKNSSWEFWEVVLERKKHSQSVVMWEIASDATHPEFLDEVKNIAQQVTILSINLTEAKCMFESENLEDVIGFLKDWGLNLVFLRRGREGAVMITQEKTVFVPRVKNINVVDPTGGGNSSSGAVLFGYCEGYDVGECGLMGSIAAALCLKQFGIPQKIGREERKEAWELLEVMKGEIYHGSDHGLPV